MLYPEKTILLKNGKTAILRSPVPEDAAAMLTFLKNTAAETDNLIRYPEECLTDVKTEEDFLCGICQSETSMMILCEIDGEIIGNCHLWYTPRIKLRHRGEVAIALLKKFWGLNIGSAMFEEMTDGIKEQTAKTLLSVMPANTIKHADAPKETSEGQKKVMPSPMAAPSSRENVYGRAATPEKQTATPYVKPKSEQVGRNDPCPCGSGKKYKKCCGAGNDSSTQQS